MTLYLYAAYNQESRCYNYAGDVSQKKTHYSVNSCLMPLCHLHGKAVTTVESISESRGSMHEIQKVLSEYHGTQCGYCTPGFIMAMYALLKNNSKPEKSEIDLALQGCRRLQAFEMCTGYRSILNAFYTFSTESAREHCEKSHQINDVDSCGHVSVDNVLIDIEDCASKCSSRRCNGINSEPILFKKTATDGLSFPAELVAAKYDEEFLRFENHDCIFYRPTSLQQLLELKKVHPAAKLVAGNTEIFMDERFRYFRHAVLIHTGGIKEMSICKIDPQMGIFIGSSVSISDMQSFLQSALTELSGKHIRNVATLTGNIVNASPISDLNPIMVATCATIVLCSDQSVRQRRVDDSFFVDYKMVDIDEKEVALGVWLPFSTKTKHFKVMKQSQRREDDIAIVNAACMVDLRKSHIHSISLTFGGLAATTRSSFRVPAALVGRRWSIESVDKMLEILAEEFQLKPGTPGGMEAYRMTLCMSMVSKFCVWIAQKLDLPTSVQGHIPFEYSYTPDCTALAKETTLETSHVHTSSKLQVSGQAKYCDDLQIINALHLSFVLSKKGHAKLLNVDASDALTQDGVVAYFDVNDIPKHWSNQFGHHKDQTMFAEREVTFFGQIIGAIVATDPEIARRASSMVEVTYEELPCIVTTVVQAKLLFRFGKMNKKLTFAQDALLHKSFFDGHYELETNWNDQCLSACEHALSGDVKFGGQEHFYFETNACIAIPGDENEMEIISSTQNPTDTQISVAEMLGIPQHKVTVSVKRIGGAFGGKETASIIVALPAAFAARKSVSSFDEKRLGLPVRCCLERFDDMVMTGTRHPFLSRYRCTFNQQGEIVSYCVDHYANCGSSYDLSVGVLQRSLFHSDNTYKIEHFRASGKMCRTNLPSCTAFRGFGGPQGMLALESCITDVAYHLDIQPEMVRERILYKEGDETPFGQRLDKCNIRRCWEECMKRSLFAERRRTIDKFNRNAEAIRVWENFLKKRGISVIPTKFGIGFGIKKLNQAGALVNIYRDGSVLLSHSGVEMGQGLNTKMAQVASKVLNISMDKIFVKQTSTETVPNMSPCAASFSSDLNGIATKLACEKLLRRLKPIIEKYSQESWECWILKAYEKRISLSATGFYSPQLTGYDWKRRRGAKMFSYFTYGVGCSEVEVDCLTGDHVVIRTDIVMDVGASLNPAIDIGQIEGAFVQGYGLFTIEEMKVSPSGIIYTRGPGTYKIPSTNDIPRQFNVTLLTGSANDQGVFSSKGVGEPPLFLGSSVFFALKDAVKSARQDNNLNGPFRFDSPATCEKIRMLCGDPLAEKVCYVDLVLLHMPIVVEILLHSRALATECLTRLPKI
ncbi:xanthine dehydrogenase [Trichuris trichiura]|uniref:Xanthine dehydrogenase n=1 Tax=Trichuris trichiura TaxID=36087 RepID=A0A077YWP9_TRITR|nr:xanthine dehydrogenase [Trichuris trichiura]